MFFRLFFRLSAHFRPHSSAIFHPNTHIIFCCPLSAYDKWWFEQKKSPHFREKYLVLSYLKWLCSVPMAAKKMAIDRKRLAGAGLCNKLSNSDRSLVPLFHTSDEWHSARTQTPSDNAVFSLWVWWMWSSRHRSPENANEWRICSTLRDVKSDEARMAMFTRPRPRTCKMMPFFLLLIFFSWIPQHIPVDEETGFLSFFLVCS